MVESRMEQMERRRRAPLSVLIQRAVYLRDCGECVYCFRKLGPREATYDHLVPVSVGGLTTMVNLAVACELCNTTRGDVRFTLWMRHREARYRGERQWAVWVRLWHLYTQAVAEVTGIPAARHWTNVIGGPESRVVALRPVPVKLKRGYR